MIRILSTMAVMGALRRIVPEWQARGGSPLEADYAPTVALLERLRAGAAGDLVFLTAGGIADMQREGIVQPGSALDIAVSRVGVAVHAGAPHPDIATVHAFRSTLLSARSVAWSRIGASGLFFASLIRRLGIEPELLAKGLVVSGFTAEKAASGEAELAIQQISELMVVPGIEVVGPLPAEIQETATFSAGLLRDAAPEAAAFLNFVKSPEMAPHFRDSGLEPLPG